MRCSVSKMSLSSLRWKSKREISSGNVSTYLLSISRWWSLIDLTSIVMILTGVESLVKTKSRRLLPSRGQMNFTKKPHPTIFLKRTFQLIHRTKKMTRCIKTYIIKWWTQPRKKTESLLPKTTGSMYTKPGGTSFKTGGIASTNSL